MNISDILAMEDMGERVKKLKAGYSDENLETWRNEFNGKHDILTNIVFRDKTISKGKRKGETVPVAKLVMRFQKKIVESAISFLFGEAVDLVLRGQTRPTPHTKFAAQPAGCLVDSPRPARLRHQRASCPTPLHPWQLLDPVRRDGSTAPVDDMARTPCRSCAGCLPPRCARRPRQNVGP